MYNIIKLKLFLYRRGMFMKKSKLLSIVALSFFSLQLLPLGQFSTKVKAAEVPVTIKVTDGYNIPEDSFFTDGDKYYFVGTKKGELETNLFSLENNVVTKISSQGLELPRQDENNNGIRYKINKDKTALEGTLKEEMYYDAKSYQGVNYKEVRSVSLSSGVQKDVKYDNDATLPGTLFNYVTNKLISPSEKYAIAWMGFNSIEGTDKYYTYKYDTWIGDVQTFHYGVVSTDGNSIEGVNAQRISKNGMLVCQTELEKGKIKYSVVDSLLNETVLFYCESYQDTVIDNNDYLYVADMQNKQTIDGVEGCPLVKVNLADLTDKTVVLDRITDGPCVAGDGSLWFYGLKDGKFILSKLENNTVVLKYSFSKMPTGISITDDTHLAFPFFTETTAGIVTVTPNSNPAASTEEVSTTTEIKTTETTTSSTIADVTIDKDKTNVVAIDNEPQKKLEVKLNADTIKDGTGALMVQSTNSTVNLPISTIDFTDVPANSQVVLAQSQSADTTVLSKVQKAVNKVFSFDLKITDTNGGEIKAIHNFKSGKATITVKLSADDIKNLDTAKMTMYYYNESTGKFEVIGGSFNKDAMTFTFETSHFSKYILAEASTGGLPTLASTAQTLPQTGSGVDTAVLVLIGMLSLAGGLVLMKKGHLN